jgi:hypothetical protein
MIEPSESEPELRRIGYSFVNGRRGYLKNALAMRLPG